MHHAGARQRGILLVQREHPAAQALVAKRVAQQSGVGDRLAVVGEADRPDLAQLAHLAQPPPGQSDADRCHEADRNAGVALRRHQHPAQKRRMVEHRVGVRHRHDRAIAARSGGPSAGLEILLMLLPGGSQVDVRVDKGREEMLALGLHYLGAGRCLQARGRTDLRDLAVAHEHVVRSVDAGVRIDHVGAAQQQLGRRAGDGDERAHAVCGSSAGDWLWGWSVSGGAPASTS